jgi:hypothetical protein
VTRERLIDLLVVTTTVVATALFYVMGRSIMGWWQGSPW